MGDGRCERGAYARRMGGRIKLGWIAVFKEDDR